MSNTKRSIDLYKKMPPKELAAIAAGIFDADELKVISSTVERKTYRMMNAAFVDWSDWFFKISTVLGLSYWKTKTSYKTMLGALHQLNKEELGEREQAMMDKVTQNIPLARANMKAALEAMRQLAERHGFKFKDALKLASIGEQELEALENVEANQEYLDYFINELQEASPTIY